MLNLLLKRAFHFVALTIMFGVLLWQNASVRAKTIAYGEIARFGQDIIGLEWSPDGKFIATNSATSYKIQIWDAKSGNIIKVLEPDIKLSNYSNYGFYPKWSPDGRYIAAVSSDNNISSQYFNSTLYIWDIQTGERRIIPNRYNALNQGANLKHELAIEGVSWKPDSKALAVSEIDGSIRLINFPSGKTYWITSAYNKAYDPSSLICPLIWNPQGTRLLCRGWPNDGIYDAHTGKLVLSLDDNDVGGGSYAEWTRDSKYILDVPVGDGGSNNKLFAWNALTGKLVSIAIKYVNAVFDINPDSQRIAYLSDHEDGSFNQDFIVANIFTGEIITKFSVGWLTTDEIRWHPDGKRFAILYNDTVRVFAENVVEM